MRNGRAQGYAMAALLVSLSIMSVMLTVAMPVWKQMATREKEAELVFRGEQYARAIGLFQRKAGPGVLPPTIDVLVQQRYLRKAYKDPITGDDFALIRQGQSPQIGPPGQVSQMPGATAGSGSVTSRPPSGGRGGGTAGAGREQRGSGPFGTPPGGAVGGIQGVASKSTDASIRQYNGRNRYNQWEFVYVQQVQAPGAGGPPGAQTPGGRGGRGQPGPPGFPGGPGRGGPGRGAPTGGPTLTPLSPQPPRGSGQIPPGPPPR